VLLIAVLIGRAAESTTPTLPFIDADFVSIPAGNLSWARPEERIQRQRLANLLGRSNNHNTAWLTNEPENERVLRGGSWLNRAEDCRPATTYTGYREETNAEWIKMGVHTFDLGEEPYVAVYVAPNEHGLGPENGATVKFRNLTGLAK
jgi:hypothetical protein